MCELLGLSFNQPVRPNLSFKGFRLRGKNNPQGWGIAFYPDKSAQVLKEPLAADSESQLAQFATTYQSICSKLLIAHVRRSSGTPTTHMNTHPFARELFGKDYIFAHNGTFSNYSRLDTGRFKPIGQTDSEYVFCHLLHLIEQRASPSWEDKDFTWLRETLQSINQYGKFNCLFSDGERLFSYCTAAETVGLSYVHRQAPYGRVKLVDMDYEIDLAKEKAPGQEGFIIATAPLTSEQWVPYASGELNVFQDGRLIFPKTDSC